ncbi:Gfo/Idh/MocA family oxidoreductase [Planctomycetales bacterium ZRK34]|nr:Gfo/Idh/MocA family oxidoreductase [Planctomycetales bacterium ZRK34]
MSKQHQPTRRTFVSSSMAALASVYVVPRHVLGGAKFVAPSEKVNLAIIGCGNQGSGIGRTIGGNKLVQVVALCDVYMDDKRTEKVREQFGEAKKFQDFRELFAQMGDQFDACTIGVPDHAHFPITMTAMSRGKHVYVEKPLAHTFNECEMMMAAAKKYGVATQMGNQGHSGANYHQFKAWAEAGVIKNVTHIDAHMNSHRRWHGWNITGYPTGGKTPAGMDWDTWAGTRTKRDYDGKYDPGNWRSWFDYGNGAFGDWGPHILDTCHRFLELGLPTEIEALKLDGPNEFIFPQASTIAFRFPKRGDKPACEVIWYDGKGNTPPRPEVLEKDRKMTAPGKIIYSDDLTFMGGTHGSPLRVIPESKMKQIANDVPRITGKHSNHHHNFVLACRGEEHTRSPFDISAPLTQVFMLGVITQRLGGKLKFDPTSKRFTNSDQANALLTRTPRAGWESYYKL